MARKKRMFKKTSLTKFEAMPDTGAWTNIAKFEKQQDGFTAAYIDKVRISYIIEGDSDGPTSYNLGALWVVSNKYTLDATDANNSEYIIGSAAGRGAGTTVTIPVKRLIRDNDVDETSGDNALMLQARLTDFDSNQYDLTMVIETWGRWHTTVSQ